MNIKNTLGRTAGIAAAAVAITGLCLTGAASASTATPAATVVRGCSIQTVNGHYLTAVGGGGRTTDVIHTDAVRVGSWEKFSVVFTNGSHVYGLQTVNGHYLTAVGGGGRITDTIHSDATRVGSWEKSRISCSG